MPSLDRGSLSQVIDPIRRAASRYQLFGRGAAASCALSGLALAAAALYLSLLSGADTAAAAGFLAAGSCLFLVVTGVVARVGGARGRCGCSTGPDDCSLVDLDRCLPIALFQWIENPPIRQAFCHVGPQIKSVFGVPVADVLADPGCLPIDADDRGTWDATRREAAAAMGEWRCEVRFVLPDGSFRWVRFLAAPKPRRGGGILFFGAIIDIDAEKQHELDLEYARDVMEKQAIDLARQSEQVAIARETADRARQYAEAANSAKSEFLASMSHELRAPLNTILGFAEIIRDEAFGPVGEPRYAEYAGDIYTSGSHLLDIISDLLDLAKIEAGRLEIVREPLELWREVAGCLRLIRQRAQNHNLTVASDVPTDLPLLHADRRALRQMLFNLLSNAIKFTPEGGRIAVAATVDEVGTCRICVTDSGIGISPDDLGKLFQPFARTQEAERRQIEGTGLGLSLVKSLIERHGGAVDVTSRPGEGSTFSLVFPPFDETAFDDPGADRPPRMISVAAD